MATKTVRVPIHRTTPTQTVAVEMGATKGATIGVDLLMPDGTLATTAKLQALFGTGTVTSSGPDTTDALDEGKYRLYFTKRRAQVAVGEILQDTATISLDFTPGTDPTPNQIAATLNDLADSGAGTLLAITRDGKGRVTGTKAATITGTAGNITVTNGDASAGLPTIDLANVSVTSGGTLKKRAFDAKGRLAQESSATTDDLSEGATNLYFTSSRVRSTTLTGLSTAAATSVTAADSVLVGIGKLQGQATANATAIAGKEPAITAGTTAQYWRGDKSWQTLNKSAVGLSNVDNTSDASKPVSTAQAAAIALKQDSSGLGTAAFANTGNNAAGLVPALDSPGAGQTSLTITGASARANLYLLSGNADVPGIGEGTVSFAGTGSVSGSTEKRLALMYVNNDGATANNRGGKFGINLKQDGNTILVSRFNISYLGHIEPGIDNTQTMGSASLRWSVVYAGTGTINTSDAREKTDVAALSDAEISASVEMARSIGTYQWLASIAEKGDNARHHAGLTVQQAIAIMQSHGLDPFRYGFICYDQWDETQEVIDPETGEILQAYRPAGDRYSFRTDELLLFMARGFDARLSALEAVN